MISIFPDTHKTIIKNVHKDIKRDYGIDLNQRRLEWGAVSPDFLKKYKKIRHYKDESIDYLVEEIVSLINHCQYVDLFKMNELENKLISYRLGVISHFLCDYVCLCHYERWTCDIKLKDHMAYERLLNKLAVSHDFTRHEFTHHMVYDEDLKVAVKALIENIVKEYGEEKIILRDLDYGYSLSFMIFSFVFETVELRKRQKDLLLN